MIYKAVLFDLDGTLLDTREDVGDAMNRVLESKGFPTHTTEDYGTFLGSGARALVVRALPENYRDEATISESLDVFRLDYQENCTVKTAAYPGIPELLDKLVARGIKIGILTNKPDDTTLVCVRDLLAQWPFDVVIGHRDGQPTKPNPGGALEAAQRMEVAPGEVLYVGDTEVDMETAQRAGMAPIGVAWGFREAQVLEMSGAQAVISEPQDLLNFISPNPVKSA